jgi:hypothetical protein
MTKKKKDIRDNVISGWLDKSIPEDKIIISFEGYFKEDDTNRIIEQIKYIIGYYRSLVELKENKETVGEEIKRIDKINEQIDELDKQLQYYPINANLTLDYKSFKGGGDWSKLIKSTRNSLNRIRRYGIFAQRKLNEIPLKTKPNKYPRDRLIFSLSGIFDDYYAYKKVGNLINSRSDFIKEILEILEIDCPDHINKIIQKYPPSE